MGPGPDGPMGGMGGMEQHHMNGSLGECSMMHGNAFVSGFSLVEPSLSCSSDTDLFQNERITRQHSKTVLEFCVGFISVESH